MKCRNCGKEIVPEPRNGYIHTTGIISCGIGNKRAEPPALRVIAEFEEDDDVDDFNTVDTASWKANELIGRHGFG